MTTARHREATLRAALGFLKVSSSEPQARVRFPELSLLHNWLDTWTGLGLITVGVERLDLRLSLSHIADNEWRARFDGDPMFASVGFGVAATPWRAVQDAAWRAMK
jgi:hypothetical protein